MKNLRLNRVFSLILMIAFCMACSAGDDNLDQGMAPDKKQDEVEKEMTTITIKNMAFSPAKITVEKGETVVWVNEDVVPHDVTDFINQEWTSGTLSTGQTFKKVIEKDLDYFCSIHPTMKGNIVLKK